MSLKGGPSLCIGTKVYSLAQYTVVQALVHALGCPSTYHCIVVPQDESSVNAEYALLNRRITVLVAQE